LKPAAIVLDCMVFIQIVASKGTSYRCFQRVLDGQRTLLMSKEVLGELQDVLHRPELRRKLPGLTEERTRALIHHISELAEHVEPVLSFMRFPPDPRDEPYLNLAIGGRAQELLTRDKALLRLSNPADPLRSQLHALHPKLRLMEPERFLESPEG